MEDSRPPQTNPVGEKSGGFCCIVPKGLLDIRQKSSLPRSLNDSVVAYFDKTRRKDLLGLGGDSIYVLEPSYNAS